MNTVTEILRPLADAKQQFISVRGAWLEFLDYLNDRNGVDLAGVGKRQEIGRAIAYAEQADEDFDRPGDSSLSDWFGSFERREDVVTACRQFLKERGLPHS